MSDQDPDPPWDASLIPICIKVKKSRIQIRIRADITLLTTGRHTVQACTQILYQIRRTKNIKGAGIGYP